MHVLSNDIKIDERALHYASPAVTRQELLREYLAVVLGHPLPGDLLEHLAQSRGIAMQDAYAVISGYTKPFFCGHRASDSSRHGMLPSGDPLRHASSVSPIGIECMFKTVRHRERSEGPPYCGEKQNAKVLRFAQNDAVHSIAIREMH